MTNSLPNKASYIGIDHSPFDALVGQKPLNALERMLYTYPDSLCHLGGHCIEDSGLRLNKCGPDNGKRGAL